MIPCVIPRRSSIEQISVSMELSSEAPGSNPHWPSDIHFYLSRMRRAVLSASIFGWLSWTQPRVVQLS